MLDKDYIIYLYVCKKLSFNEIGKIVGYSHPTISKWLRKWNVPIRNFNEQMSIALGKRQADYTDYSNLTQIIEGGLLGDGGIYNTKYQSYYQHGCIKKDYIEYLQNTFILSGLNSRISVIDYKDKRPKSKKIYQLTTRSNMFLRNNRLNWYKNNIKSIPYNLKLTPQSVLHWWIGDGYLNKDWGWGTLSTQSFSKEGVQKLKKLLNKITKNNITIRNDCNSNGMYFLYLSRRAVNDLVDYMGDCPVESFRYKWEIKC